jgi:hypothetical protein
MPLRQTIDRSSRLARIASYAGPKPRLEIRSTEFLTVATMPSGDDPAACTRMLPTCGAVVTVNPNPAENAHG